MSSGFCEDCNEATRVHCGNCGAAHFATFFAGAGKRRRLGFLAIGDGSGKALNQSEVAFIDALRSLGWIQGKNLTIEYRFSQPADRLTDSIAELMALGPDILIAPGPQAAIALKSATGTVPIVFVGVADPVHLGKACRDQVAT
nr:ABC transporter substrate binding protein [Bradyrhizobium sp. 87]